MFSMGFALPLLCNTRNSLIELSSSLAYPHSLYSAVTDMYVMLSLYLCLMPCMIRRGKTSRPWQWFRYSYVCSSVMSVHPKGGASARDARISLFNDVVSGLNSVAGCGSTPWFVEVGGRW